MISTRTGSGACATGGAARCVRCLSVEGCCQGFGGTLVQFLDERGNRLPDKGLTVLAEVAEMGVFLRLG